MNSHIAFKEWAVVVDALLRGRQTIILRKGGIVEKKGQFTVDHQAFFLFSTYLHQNADDLIPEEHENFRRLHGQKPDENSLKIDGYFEVKQVEFLKDWETVKQVQPFGIWSLPCLEERFNWGKEKGIHLIVGRVYRLPQPATLPMLQAYGGCKSWVELNQPVSLDNALPVLADLQFEEELRKFSDKLRGGGRF